MALIAGIDIGNATTEVALAELTDQGETLSLQRHCVHHRHQRDAG